MESLDLDLDLSTGDMGFDIDPIDAANFDLSLDCLARRAPESFNRKSPSDSAPLPREMV